MHKEPIPKGIKLALFVGGPCDGQIKQFQSVPPIVEVKDKLYHNPLDDNEHNLPFSIDLKGVELPMTPERYHKKVMVGEYTLYVHEDFIGCPIDRIVSKFHRYRHAP